MNQVTLTERIKPKDSSEITDEFKKIAPRDQSNCCDGILKAKNFPGLEETSSELNDRIYRWTFIPRVMSAALWPIILIYSTYKIYLETTDSKFDLFHRTYPGIFTNVTGRGVDKFDHLWFVLSGDFFGKCYLWYGFYGGFARLIQIYMPQALPTFSMLLSFGFVSYLMGFRILAFFLLELVVFWIVQRLRSKLALWMTVVGYLYFMSHGYYEKLLLDENPSVITYYMFTVIGWIHARCISFYYDTWNRPNRSSLASLYTSAQFCFYFPLTVWGPLEYFERYEKYILLPSKFGKSTEVVKQELLRMIVKLGRFIFWALVNELLLHYVYFTYLSYHPVYLETINFWALIGILYWLGQFLQLKYLVLNGIPGVIAEADGLPMLPLPKCVACIHRFSNLWKSIDRGMYNWFIRYCYSPVLEIIARVDKTNGLQPEFQRILASLPAFLFVYTWHAWELRILIWASLNFFCVSAERIGGFLKNKINQKYNVAPAIWDVLIEPMVNIPFLTISCCSSGLFSSSIATGKVMAYRIPQGYQFIVIGWGYTHLGVLIDTWPKVREVVFRRSKSHHEN
ncbi:unnamed protein product [Allacma fusca]|uniref:Uncharacterized protein n=1 Tax=Allacma fusca TaxID=39272 RepID=A0A8J2JVZ1_9HEXA|nr:unnamed protein product [Allacma fusca]